MLQGVALLQAAPFPLATLGAHRRTCQGAHLDPPFGAFLRRCRAGAGGLPHWLLGGDHVSPDEAHAGMGLSVVDGRREHCWRRSCHRQVVVGASAHAEHLVLAGGIVEQIDRRDQVKGTQPEEQLSPCWPLVTASALELSPTHTPLGEGPFTRSAGCSGCGGTDWSGRTCASALPAAGSWRHRPP